MIHVARIGLTGYDDEQAYDGPENAMQHVLREMEARGAVIQSVSFLRSTRGRERYEVFVVYHGSESSADD